MTTISASLNWENWVTGSNDWFTLLGLPAPANELIVKYAGDRGSMVVPWRESKGEPAIAVNLVWTCCIPRQPKYAIVRRRQEREWIIIHAAP